MKTRLKSSRIKRRKDKLKLENLSVEIFEKSYIEYKRNKINMSIQKKFETKYKNNIVVSENFNLVYFENDYFEDIQKYLTSSTEVKAVAY